MAGRTADRGKMIYDYAKRGRNVDGIIHDHGEGASLEWTDTQGNTALTLACILGDNRNGRKNIAETLVRLRANVSHCGHDGWTPLHHAVDNGHVDIVKLLLNNGANALTMTDSVPSPLEIAQRKGFIVIVDLLKESQPTAHSTRGNATLRPPSTRGHATPRPLSARGSATPRSLSTRGSVPPRPLSTRGSAPPRPLSTRGSAPPKPSSSRSLASRAGELARDVVDGFLRKGASAQDTQNESTATNISNSNNSPTQITIGWTINQLNTLPSLPIKETNFRAAASSSSSYPSLPEPSSRSIEECQICTVARGETTFIPCRHKACSSCSNKIKGEKEVFHCPVCGKKIERITQTYPTERA